MKTLDEVISVPEALAVMAAVAILASILIPMFHHLDKIESERKARAETNLVVSAVSTNVVVKTNNNAITNK